MTLPDTPFRQDLFATVEALYRLAPDRVPPTLMVCHCPCCMTRETLAEIVATPVRDLSSALIQEYSNSAHGDPTDPDDLLALLPRYLDLIAQDIEVDYNSVRADLKRFGDGRGIHPGFPPPAMVLLMDQYAHALLHHFAALQVMDVDAVETPWMLVEILVVGGWPVAAVTGPLDDLFARPDIGRGALIGFLVDMARSQRDGRLELWALAQYRREAAADLAAWLSPLLESDAVTEILTDPALPDEAQLWLPSLAGLKGRLTAEMLGG
ncbi:hypothetical protein [Tabrizicola sp.]|uniref:hypothetical protein n=1 Tax=Tabrizicola sp. TaxID=2005166 RepID=UPI003F3B0CAD